MASFTSGCTDLRWPAPGSLPVAVLVSLLLAGCAGRPQAGRPEPVHDPSGFDLQGHRGARGLRPENTLPAFEAALDQTVTTLELDLQLTADSQLVVFHDADVGPEKCRVPTGQEGAAPAPSTRPAVRALRLAELRLYVCDRNPDAARFPRQDREPTLVTVGFLRAGADPIRVYRIPTLEELFRFVRFYADSGRAYGKRPGQIRRAATVGFNIETKRVPFRPELIGDGFDASGPGYLERRLVEMIESHGLVDRAVIQSFDHRSVRAIADLNPRITTSALLSNTAPVRPGRMVREARAGIWSPDYRFLDEAGVREAHGAGVRVIPWTVNEPEAMRRLIDMGVDGIITDVPDVLREVLMERGRAW